MVSTVETRPCAAETPTQVQPLMTTSPHTPHVTDFATYKDMYTRSIDDPDGFWGDIASQFFWNKKWDEKHVSYNFDTRKGPIHTRWFEGGATNISYNCLDRNVSNGLGDTTCFIWEGNEPRDSGKMTYFQVLAQVCKLANWLLKEGVKQGDTIVIYMPMIFELPIAMLACARIGAVHAVVFGGFSAGSLADRIVDCGAKIMITATAGMRGKKLIPLQSIADEACRLCINRHHPVECCLVVKVLHAAPEGTTSMKHVREIRYQDTIPLQDAVCTPVWVPAEHPLFLLYTSGSTAKPKGVQHSTGGYMCYAATGTKYVFDLHEGDVFWSTGDIGWITGHSCLVYGSLLNGVTSIIFEGIPSYPDHSRLWQIVEKHQVNSIFTSPTAIRGLMRHGDAPVKKHDRSSLRVLGTAGEPINPGAWHWFEGVVGEHRCPVMDNWWQTETGAHMLTGLPGAWPDKPGAASFPFFGVAPVILHPESGAVLEGACEGVLCFSRSWPSAIRGILGDSERFKSTYFEPYPGYYFSGDGARRDADGYYWITGRLDDVINVSGHRIGSTEVESCLARHASVSEAAVVGYDHPVKGQGIYAYVTLMSGTEESDSLTADLKGYVRSSIGSFAVPDVIHWTSGLPKTRSGKVMRRILRKVAEGKFKEIGDVSTLADPTVINTLITLKPKL